jgi:hypothetical protein
MTSNESENFPTSPTPPEGLFGIYVQFLSAERQLIWDRFSAMLVANTIILNALTDIYNDSTERLFTLIACVFGMLLCIAWLMMTYEGWEYTDKLRKDAVNCFRWEGCPNPLIPERKKIIRRATISVIVLFIITYVLILIRVLIRALVPFNSNGVR